MSVLTRTLHRTPVVPTPRPAQHDGGLVTPPLRQTDPTADRTSRRRRAALVLVAVVAAIAAAVTTAVVQLTGDDPAPAGTTQLSGVTELDTIRDEMLLRRELTSDASRASDASRDAAQVTR